MMQRFNNDRQGSAVDYERWRDSHLHDGYIVNEAPGDYHGTRLHHASCPTLQRPIDEGKHLLAYPKHCSTDRSELEREFPRIIVCGTCGAELMPGPRRA
jgi:hypothetical protein